MPAFKCLLVFVLCSLFSANSKGETVSQEANDSIFISSRFYDIEAISDSVFISSGIDEALLFLKNAECKRVVCEFLSAKYNLYLINYQTAYAIINGIKNDPELNLYVSDGYATVLLNTARYCAFSHKSFSYNEFLHKITDYTARSKYDVFNYCLLSYAFQSHLINNAESKKSLEELRAYIVRQKLEHSYLYQLNRFFLGENYSLSKSPLSAIREFNYVYLKSLQLFPEDEFLKRVYYEIGLQYRIITNYDEACKYLEKFLQVAPNHYYVHVFNANELLCYIKLQQDSTEKALHYAYQMYDVVQGKGMLYYYYATTQLYQLLKKTGRTAEIDPILKEVKETLQLNLVLEQKILAAYMLSDRAYTNRKYSQVVDTYKSILSNRELQINADSLLNVETGDMQRVSRYALNKLYYRLFIAYYYQWKDNRTDIESLRKSFLFSQNHLKLHMDEFEFMMDRSFNVKSAKTYDYTLSNLFSPGYQLWHETHDTSIFNSVLNYVERGRSLIFRTSLKDISVRKQLGVSDELLQSEIQLRRKIDSLNSQLELEQRESISLLNEQKNIIYRAYDSLLFQMQLDYPQLRKLTNKSTELSLELIRGYIGKETSVVCYQQTHNAIFILYIDEETMRFSFSNFSNEDIERLKELNKIISTYDANIFEKKEFDKFVDLSAHFYSLLIAPIDSLIKGKRLFVLPDKYINNIPFDILIDKTKLDSSQTYTYRNLPYLLHEVPVSIFYVFEQLADKSLSIKNPKFAAFAPYYNNQDEEKFSPFNDLSGAKNEVDYINNILNGRSFKGRSASKNKFTQLPDHYDILHFALHTNINPKEPLKSQLLFSTDTADHIKNLNMYETFGISKKASLVVLGGCSTGKGNVYAGEGIMNLARSFFYMGAKNAIVAQWPISDKAGAEIFISFYKGIKQGLPSDKSLQQAKINYLKNNDNIKSHPYFWSNIQSVGMPSAFHFTYYYRHEAAILFMLLAGGGLAALVYFFKKRFS